MRLRLISVPGGGFVRPASGLRAREDRLDLDAVLVCCHGGPGEDGTLQGALDLTGVRYSGPTAMGAALGMDKLAFGALVIYAGLPTLPRVPLSAEQRGTRLSTLPYILKPRFGGSSIGIEVVADFDTARARLKANPHLREGAVLEPYQARDVRPAACRQKLARASAIGHRAAASHAQRRRDPRLRGQVRRLRGDDFGAPRAACKIEPELEERIRKLVPEVASLVGLRGVARLDFLSDGEDVFINEINTIPGSLSHYLWIDPRLPFTSLLARLADRGGQATGVRLLVGGFGRVRAAAAPVPSRASSDELLVDAGRRGELPDASC